MVHKCTAQIQLTNRTLLDVQSFERGLVQILCIKKKCVSMQKFSYHSLVKIIQKSTRHCNKYTQLLRSYNMQIHSCILTDDFKAV